MNTNPTIGFLEVTLTRFFFLFALNLPLMKYYGESYLNMDKKTFNQLSIRFIVAYSSYTLQYYTIAFIPVGVFLSIQNSSPLFTAIFAFLLLREIQSKYEILNMLISFSGVLLTSFASFSNNQ
jgi:drug/metabolite transporter (DMT)-like permease